jgi:four helix bundle protein
MQSQPKIKSYRDLNVWQKAMDLATLVYAHTEAYPKTESYGLTSQLRRAAVSVASNIAEGSAKRSTREFIRFINIASGSVAELQTQTILSQHLGYIDEVAYNNLIHKMDEIGRMLHGLQESLHERLDADSLVS